MPFIRDPVTGLPGYKLPDAPEDQQVEVGGESVKMNAGDVSESYATGKPLPYVQDRDFDEPYEVTGPEQAAKEAYAVNRANVGVLGVDFNRSSEKQRQRDRADFRREMSLRMAQEADPQGAVDQVVLRAQAYLMFLEGEDYYRQADTQPAFEDRQ